MTPGAGRVRFVGMRISAGLLLLTAGCAGYEFGGPVARSSDRFFESFHEDPRRATTVRGPGGGAVGNVWVELDVMEEGESESDRVGVLWELAEDAEEGGGRGDGDAENAERSGGRGDGLRRNGVRAAPVRADAQVEFRARADRVRWTRRIQAGLLVAPGRAGVLRCGETVPLPGPVTVVLPGGAVRTVAWREIGLEWSVVAEIVENRRLRLVLAPRLADAQGASADFQELAVDLTLDEGQSVVFGVAESAEESGRRGGVAEGADPVPERGGGFAAPAHGTGQGRGLGGVLFESSRETGRRRRVMIVTPWIR